MKKKKLNIKELKLKRIVEELSKEQQHVTKGGIVRTRGTSTGSIRGTRFTEVATRDGILDGMNLFSEKKKN